MAGRRATATEPATWLDRDPELAFHFVAGRPSLDLAATLGERWRRAIERLRSPDDLARWSVAAGLAARPPVVTEGDLAAVRRLRGAILRVALAWSRGEPLPDDDLAAVNAAAAVPDVPPRLAADGRLAPPQAADVAAVAATCARDLVTLVATGDPGRLRECAADDCSLLFYDASRPGRRRWCSMQACGNRAKVAAHRARHDDPTDDLPAG